MLGHYYLFVTGEEIESVEELDPFLLSAGDLLIETAVLFLLALVVLAQLERGDLIEIADAGL